MSLIHNLYLKEKLEMPINEKGILNVGINLNEYFNFGDANKYAEKYALQFARKTTDDSARQEKSSKDSVLGKLVEETIVYLLNSYFEKNELNYLATNNKTYDTDIEYVTKSLCIIRKNTNHIKEFDSDIFNSNRSQNYE